MCDDFPRVRDADFAAAKQGVDGKFGLLVGDGGLAQIDFDAAENGGDAAALEVQAGDAALAAAE